MDTTISDTRQVDSAEQLKRIKQEIAEKHAGETIEWATCAQNGCFSTCLLKVHTKDGKITAIDTDNTIHENCAREDAYADFEDFEQGMFQYRACVRGRGWKQDVYNENRILYPMKRTGKRGSGQFERISWEEALDTVAEMYRSTREKHGPLSVWGDGFMGASTDYLGEHLPGGALGAWGCDSFESFDFANTYCYGKTNSIQTMVVDGGAEAMTLFDAKAIVLWGVDFLLNYPEYAYYFLLAKDKGIPTIVIDPRYSWTAHHADQWIPIRPSTDGAMMEAMAYVIFEENLADTDFISKWVEPVGYQKWYEYIIGEYDGIAKTPEWAEAICGIPAETIAGLARLISDAPVYMRMAWAAARKHYGENQARTINYLMAITGNLGKNGNSGSGIAFGVGARLQKVPFVDYGITRGDYGITVALQAELWHKAVLLREPYERGEITLHDYKAEIGCPDNADAPNIKMMFIAVNQRNSGIGYYDANERLEAMKKMDYIVYAAYNWSQTTAWYADIVLPLSHQFFEGGGAGSFMMQGYSFQQPGSGTANNYFIGAGKVVESPGECRTKLWIMKEVANRLGIGDRFAYKIKDTSWEDYDTTMTGFAADCYNLWRTMPNVEGLNPPTWEEWLKQPVFRTPITDDYWVWGKDNFKPDGAPLATPSGKIEFESDFLANRDYSRLSHDTKTFGKGQIAPYARYKEAPYSLLQPIANEYPLHLITPHSFFRQHFCQDGNPWFRDEYRNSVWISAVDAKARDINDGDLVRVANDVGECLVSAYVTSRLTPGVTCLIFGRQYEPASVKTDLMPDGIDRAGSCNFLIPGEHFDARRGSLLCNSMVQIEKMEQHNPVLAR